MTDVSAQDCSPSATAPSADTQELDACSEDGKTKYHLGPSALSGSHVKSAKADQANGRWQVDVEFDSLGAKTFGDLTTSLAGTGKLIAITVGGTVISAPSVQVPITDGELRISGQFDRTGADELAAALTAGAES
ncbi:SecDF P1 head subdomain-containing protein [Catenulispora subtropica]|uniref:SecDF P1 head subdomain domain-containing protein n=1 Tax=Catenulispora subtropica TaxID=450798 RepID=A0ABP5DRK9_9ACTN